MSERQSRFKGFEEGAKIVFGPAKPKTLLNQPVYCWFSYLVMMQERR